MGNSHIPSVVSECFPIGDRMFVNPDLLATLIEKASDDDKVSVIRVVDNLVFDANTQRRENTPELADEEIESIAPFTRMCVCDKEWYDKYNEDKCAEVSRTLL